MSGPTTTSLKIYFWIAIKYIYGIDRPSPQPSPLLETPSSKSLTQEYVLLWLYCQ